MMINKIGKTLIANAAILGSSILVQVVTNKITAKTDVLVDTKRTISETLESVLSSQVNKGDYTNVSLITTLLVKVNRASNMKELADIVEIYNKEVRL